MGLIEKPGAYDGISNEIYHGQLTPTPSMSASMAVELMATCPRILWTNSYLNPDHERKQKSEFNLGTAAHLALLEPNDWSARTIIVDASDYKTVAARQARDAAYAEGKTPLLPKHVEQVIGIRDAALNDPDAQWLLTADGVCEQTVVWRDRKTGLYLKCRPDKAARDWSWIADLKTTTCAQPSALKKKAHDSGWAQCAAWYLDGVFEATGIRPETFYFIVAEVDAPHVITVCRYRPQMGSYPRAIEWGQLMNRKAIHTFAECVATNIWPKYADGVVDLDLPSYAEFQLEDRRAAGEFETKPTPAALQKAASAQRPITLGA